MNPRTLIASHWRQMSPESEQNWRSRRRERVRHRRGWADQQIEVDRLDCIFWIYPRVPQQLRPIIWSTSIRSEACLGYSRAANHWVLSCPRQIYLCGLNFPNWDCLRHWGCYITGLSWGHNICKTWVSNVQRRGLTSCPQPVHWSQDSLYW